MRVPISLKLILYFLTISIISIFVVGKYSYEKAKNALLSRTYEQLISVRTEKEKRIINFFNQRINDIENIAKHADTKEILSQITGPLSNSIFNKYIYGYLQAGDFYKKIIFIDTQSNILSYQLTNNDFFPGINNDNLLSYSVFFNDTLKNNSIIISEIKSNNDNPIINIGIKVFNDKNIIIGTLILEIAHERIDEIMFENKEHKGLGKTGEVYLVGNDYLMRSSSRFQSNSIFETKVETQGVINAFKGIAGFDKIKDYRNIDVLSSYNSLPINGLNWIILAEIDYDEVMSIIGQIENHIMYLSIIVSLILLGIIATLSSNITSPIRKLQAATEDILKGDYGKTLNLKYDNEIGDLIYTFNRMTVKLKEQSEKIEYEQTIRTTAVINGQEDERQRLSRELHDGLAQYVLAIKMKLEHIFSTDENKQQLIEEAKNLFSETIKEISNISNNLMPAVLKEYGLIKAIEKLAVTINKESDLKFNFKFSTKKEKLNEKIEVYLYRIVQEALSNTIKHAKAKDFFIELYEEENRINLLIKDSGIGFDSSEQNTMKGNGLINIKERVKLLSGNIYIKSKINNGVLIKISIPL
ncbi:MAG: HAMP domain-containing protein [Bacteroidales bacterium]|nr:HAMP domain-containing protein [Bacteroidales bacterium]